MSYYHQQQLSNQFDCLQISKLHRRAQVSKYATILEGGSFSGHTLHIQIKGFFMCTTNYPFSHILVVTSLVQSIARKGAKCAESTPKYKMGVHLWASPIWYRSGIVCLIWTFIAVRKLLESKNCNLLMHEYLRVIVYKPHT